MINPDKHIRAAFAQALSALAYPVYDKRVPKTDTPDEYILISSQTQLDERPGRGCAYKDCTIVLDLNIIQPLSYVSSVAIDDMLEAVLNAITQDVLNIAHFRLNDLEVDGTPRDLSFDTDTQTILRKVLTFRLEIEPTP